ncbi:hypothetical protein NDU88_005542 [Pleurodeles waltl]|uniref:Uncharacterized protein n=1 Tax=Pleurodeles waltl TaxID=8319 RepID=A0AAV7VM01_PLEWA|nr:hypothetical protein NDU88_005542 [Pleurodeles waltl]
MDRRSTLIRPSGRAEHKCSPDCLPAQAASTSHYSTRGAHGLKYPLIGPPRSSPAMASVAQPRSRGATIRQGRVGRGLPHHTSDRGSTSALGRTGAIPREMAPGPAPPPLHWPPIVKGNLLHLRHCRGPSLLSTRTQARPTPAAGPGRRNAELSLQPGRASQSGGHLLDGQATPPHFKSI